MSHQALSPIPDACAVRAVGEDVASGSTGPEALVALSMNSAGHRANVLDATFTYLGVGAMRSSTGRWYGVQVVVRTSPHLPGRAPGAT